MKFLQSLTVFFTTFIFSSCSFLEDSKNYQDNHSEIQNVLGFKHGSPYVLIEGKAREVFTIETVNPSGEFYKAGVREGDIVLGIQILKFYSRLQSSKGKMFTFTVVEGGNGSSIKKRERRIIKVNIPK
jgi:hypothetical protein